MNLYFNKLDIDLDNLSVMDITIGSDEVLYLLVRDTNNSLNKNVYSILRVILNWKDNVIFQDKITHENFSKYSGKLNKTKNGFLLSKGRVKYSESNQEHNAVLLNNEGYFVNSFCIGDGVEDCIVDDNDHIIVSYFDEGIFGNYGWTNPIGRQGIIKWDVEGNKIWENSKYDIADCYAMTLDQDHKLWFYYYSDFKLIKQRRPKDFIFDPELSGAQTLIVNSRKKLVIMDKGYDNHFDYLCIDLKTKAKEDVTFMYREQKLEGLLYYRGTKIILENKSGLYFLEW